MSPNTLLESTHIRSTGQGHDNMRSEPKDPMITSESTDSILGGEVLRRIGHSLRSPLSEIAITARLMLGEGVDLEQRRNLARIEDSADQILDVLNDLLDVAELDSGNLTVQEVPFRLPDVIREAVRAQRVLADERSIPLTVHGLSALPTDLIGDPGRIRQVLGHLISDSIRAVSHGKVQVAAQLVEHSPSSAVVRFGVRRSGAALTADQLADIESPFNHSLASGHTSGMDLAIASKIVEAMGGRLATVKPTSAEPIIEFTLTFARTAIHDEAHGVPGSESKWVAIVAENPAVGASFVDSLRIDGFEPTLYESIALASTAISLSDDPSTTPSVVVLAPSDDPFEAASRAMASPVLGRSRILLVVPHGQRGDAEACVNLGVGGYLPQPASSVDLIDAVRMLAVRQSNVGPLITRHWLRERRRPLRILVADDSPTGRAVVMRSLEQIGHTTEGAVDGRQAIEMVEAGDFDVVLMDMEMPEMDGVEATRALRGLDGPASKTPVVGVSAHAFSADRAACLAAGMNEHFTKPFRIEELQVALERLVES